MSVEMKYGTLNVVDEKTLAAFHIETPTVSGWIFGAVVYDVTDDKDYIYSEKSGRNPFPVQIPRDHVISVSVSADNTGSESQRMTLTVELVDPDGIVRGSRSASAVLSPGTTISSGRTPNFEPDKAGTWKIHAVLEAELA
jgi:hypothetical protein